MYIGAAGPWSEEFGRLNKQGIDLALAEINARPVYFVAEHSVKPAADSKPAKDDPQAAAMRAAG